MIPKIYDASYWAAGELQFQDVIALGIYSKKILGV